jgi:hypothetical protein
VPIIGWKGEGVEGHTMFSHPTLKGEQGCNIVVFINPVRVIFSQW